MYPILFCILSIFLNPENIWPVIFPRQVFPVSVFQYRGEATKYVYKGCLNTADFLHTQRVTPYGSVISKSLQCCFLAYTDTLFLSAPLFLGDHLSVYSCSLFIFMNPPIHTLVRRHHAFLSCQSALFLNSMQMICMKMKSND